MEAPEILEALEEHIREMLSESNGEAEALAEEAAKAPTEGRLKEVVMRRAELTAEITTLCLVAEFIAERREYDI